MSVFGDTVGTSAPRPDWNQSDPKRADYILNKPTKLSEFNNDEKFLKDSEVPAWARQTEKPAYTADEVNADPAGTSETKTTEHNTDSEAHGDLRLEVAQIKQELAAFLDIDDETLDQLSELIAAIVDNKTDIAELTSGKVNKTDIVDNLTTNAADKVLSAAQGVVLKLLFEGIKVITKLAEMEDDSAHRTVTDAEKSTWNGKSNFSGSYNDLTNKPTAAQIGADPEGSAANAVANHNTNKEAHNDLRLELQNLKTQIETLLDSDDTTLDQMSEVVAYIKNNKSLIDGITTSKVGKSDIVDNLVTNATDKVLSSAQGVALKALIDAIPAWAKAANKPSYTASEVGARESTWVPTAAQVGARESTWVPTAAQVGAVPTSSALTVTGVDADGATHTWTMYGVKN